MVRSSASTSSRPSTAPGSSPAPTSSVTRPDPRSTAPAAVSSAGALAQLRPLTGSSWPPARIPASFPHRSSLRTRTTTAWSSRTRRVARCGSFPGPGTSLPTRVSSVPTMSSSPRRQADRRRPGGESSGQHHRQRHGPHRLPVRRARARRIRGGAAVEPGARTDLARRPAADRRHPQLSTALRPTGHIRTLVTAGHNRGLSSRACDVLRRPQRRVPDARREFPGHRDQLDWVDAMSLSGSVAWSTNPTRGRLALGHERDLCRPIPHRGLQHPRPDRGVQPQRQRPLEVSPHWSRSNQPTLTGPASAQR